MTTYIDRLKNLGACSEAIDWCRAHHPTGLRTAWEDCGNANWMLWLLTMLDHRRGIGITVEVVRATCAHLAIDEVTVEVLNPLAAWAAGDDTVDVVAVRVRAWELRRTAAAYAAYATDAAYAAYASVYAADAADATAAAVAVAATDAVVAAYAADAAADWTAMQAAMIRDLVAVDEVTRMLADKKGGG